MVTTLRDFYAAGALNSLIPIAGFVDDSTFFTKALDVGVVYRLTGVDYESLDHPARARVAHRFEQASRLLDERFRLMQVQFKRQAPIFTAPACTNLVAAAAIQRDVAHLNAQRDTLYTFETYAVILATGLVPTRRTPQRPAWRWTRPQEAVRALFSTSAVVRVLERDLARAVGALHHVATGWQSHLADTVRPEWLGQDETYRFFRRLLNHSPVKIAQPLVQLQHLDYHLGDSEVRLYADRLTIDGQTVRLMAMKAPPAHTFAHIFQGLQRDVAGEWTACLDWHAMPVSEARRQFWSQKTRHAGNAKRRPLTASREMAPSDMIRDESAEASAAQIGAALVDMEVKQQRFGACAFTLALMDSDPVALDQAVADATKVMAGHDGQFVDETYNHGNAWLAMIPGNHAYQMRSMPLTDQNLADLSFLFTLDQGQAVSPHLKAPALAVFKTRSSTPYRLNLHVKGVGHGAVIGPTGAGKSYLVNKVITHAQQYDTFTAVIDIGHSYRQITQALGGRYLELALDRTTVQMNPFAMPPTPANWEFQQRFLRVLLEGSGQQALTAKDDRDLHAAVRTLASADYEPRQRKLSALRFLVPKHLQRRLDRWMAGERYGHFFDHAADDLTLATLQVFELSAMKDVPDVLDPVLFYVLHRVRRKIHTWPALSLCINDEVWRVMQHPKVYDYQQDVMKMGRKENAAMILVSQSMQDFGALERDVIDNCPTKYLLGNDRLDRETYRTAFHLNDLELDTVEGLQSPGEVFLKRPDVSKVLRVEADPISHELYALRQDDAVTSRPSAA